MLHVLSVCAGLGIVRPIHIEPGLFEWLGWCRNGPPPFMTHAELVDVGFNIMTSYEPACPTSSYNMDETIEQYYDRCHSVTKSILQRHEHEGNLCLSLLRVHELRVYALCM